MRIGLITGEFPPMQGGVGAFTDRLAQAMAAEGHQVHVITHRKARPDRRVGGLRELARLREPLEQEWGLLHPVGQRWGWRDVGQIAQVALRHELDVINIQYQAAAYNMRSPAINLAPWRLRGLATTVVTFHDLRVPYLFPKAGSLRNYVVRLAARKAQGAIVTNAEDEATVTGWGMAPAAVRRIPIGSNILVHEVGDGEIRVARRRIGVADDAFLLGYFGFLNASKGADSLVQALSSLDDSVHLMLMGGRTGSSDADNNRRFVEYVEALAEEGGVLQRLHWTGYLPDRDLSVLFCAADTIVLPYRDGVSLRRGTLMAALAHGRPIISTEPVRPIAELEHGRNIYLVPRDNIDALVRAITSLKRDAKARAKLASGAQTLSATFSWKGIASRTLTFFQQLSSSRPAR